MGRGVNGRKYKNVQSAYRSADAHKTYRFCNILYVLGAILGNGGNGAYLMYGNTSVGVGLGGSYFLVPFISIHLVSVVCELVSYSVVKMCTQHEAVSGQVICKVIPTLQH